jgi:hypothetical protein
MKMQRRRQQAAIIMPVTICSYASDQPLSLNNP